MFGWMLFFRVLLESCCRLECFASRTSPEGLWKSSMVSFNSSEVRLPECSSLERFRELLLGLRMFCAADRSELELLRLELKLLRSLLELLCVAGYASLQRLSSRGILGVLASATLQYPKGLRCLTGLLVLVLSLLRVEVRWLRTLLPLCFSTGRGRLPGLL